MTTKPRHGLSIWIAAVVLGIATAVVLKQLGVFYAFAEGSGFLVGGLVGWLWVRQRVIPSDKERTRRFWTWTVWWVTAALVGVAIRIAPWP